jgi:hypothetical protein
VIPPTPTHVARFALVMFDKVVESPVRDALPFALQIAGLCVGVLRERLIRTRVEKVVEELAQLEQLLRGIDPFNADQELRAVLERVLREETLQ